MDRHQVPDLWRGKNLFMLHPLQRYKILKLIRIFHFCLEISGSETNALSMSDSNPASMAGPRDRPWVSDSNPIRARIRACLAIKGGKKEHSDNFPIMVARNNVNRPSHAHGSRPEP